MLEVQGHNVIVGIDRSGSMDERDCDGNVSRYDFLKEKLATFVGEATKSAYNNQVTGLFFNDNVKTLVFTKAQDVTNAMNSRDYRTGGGTNTHGVIEAAFKLAQQTPTVPTMFFLATDGHPTGDSSEAKVDAEIISITKRIKNPEDFRIMVLTVGQRNAELEAFLKHLDADLGKAGALFDIVGQNDLIEVDFREAAAELIASTTTNSEAAAGVVTGKAT